MWNLIVWVNHSILLNLFLPGKGKQIFDDNCNIYKMEEISLPDDDDESNYGDVGETEEIAVSDEANDWLFQVFKILFFSNSAWFVFYLLYCTLAVVKY